MFTGIVEAVGAISSFRKNGNGAVMTVHAPGLDFSDVRIGDSIACNGVCVTVTSFANDTFSADLSLETLLCTSFKQAAPGKMINLEKAMSVSGRMGGHIVQGHVDGVGTISSMSRTDNAVDIWINAPEDISRYIAIKGSITINGISLTDNEVKGDAFRLTLIPHTHDITNATMWNVGDKVNIEVDVLARYLERLLNHGHDNKKKSTMTASFLMENGFM